MDENTKCVLLFLIAMVAIVVVFYLVISQGATKGQTLKSVTEAFSRAKTVPQVIFAVFASAWILLKTGAWGSFSLIVVVAINGVVVMCGQNPWPFYLELWDRIVALITGRTSAPATPPA